MADGADVIYQATFFDGRWRGHADFLLRVESPERPSRWGPYHYEVVDTKLARHVKAGAVLQLCSYVDLLDRDAGRAAGVHVRRARRVSAATVERLRVDDYMAYYRAVEGALRGRRGADAPQPAYPPLATYPEPVEHCDVCRWDADARRAGARTTTSASSPASPRGSARRSTARGVTTLEALGELPLPMTRPWKARVRRP